MTAVLFVVFACSLWMVGNEAVAHKALRARMEREQARYDEALKKQEELKKVLTLMDSQEYLEFEAKQKLNLKKEGEQVFIIGTTQGEGKTEPSQTASPQRRAKGWFDFLGI